MIDLEILKTYAIDLLAQKTENGIGLEMLGEYTKTITNFVTFINDKNEDKYIPKEYLKPLVMDYFTSCVDKCSDNAEKIGKITEIITVYTKFITETLEAEGECET